MFLSGLFRETRAHELMLRFGNLPRELLNRVCGDFLENEFQYALEQTVESTNGIRLLIQNRDADQRVRLGALESIERLVGSGRLQRPLAVLYLRDLFNGKLERVRSELWDCLVGTAVLLSAAELLPEIRQASEEGLCSPEFNLEEIEEGLADEWEDFDRVLYKAFGGRGRPPLDHLTGKGWWTRSYRNA